VSHPGLLSVPLKVLKDVDLDFLRLDTERKERDALRKFLLQDDRKQPKIYYNPEMEPP